ncbi:hypothetical protein AALP_AA1G066900 [Arabis alpina]|uniref:Uncharacterized protein n=1 Tax=Arabis alpina TaxID=50452 RepID=A0A087HLK0_ARAAL|nr:hypothetical protein AALP_AA1G066900 [Arabis alpina]
MERTTMKVKRPSLSSSISKLHDSIDKMDKLSKAILILNSSVHRENIITGLQCYGVMLKSTILELQAIKGLTETYMKKAREMQPELYSYTNNKCKLNNSIHKMEKLYKPIVSLYNMDAAWRNLLIPDFQLLGAKLKSTILELQAVKVLVRQRKEALPKGKRYMCFTLSDWRSRIEMYESEVEGLEGVLAVSKS